MPWACKIVNFYSHTRFNEAGYFKQYKKRESTVNLRVLSRIELMHDFINAVHNIFNGRF